MDVRKKLFALLQDCNNPSWKWFPNNAEMMKLIDYLISHGVTVQEWISVKDRLPDVDGKYLVARAEGGRYSISVRKFRKEVPCWYTGYCGHWERRTNGITHWMPLPQPPKGE